MRCAPSTHSGGARDERDPDEIAARVRAVRIARQVRAGQNRHIIVGVQAAGELGVRQAGARHVGPQVERGVGQLHVDHVGEHRCDRIEFLQVQRAVLAHVRLVVPRGDARVLPDRRQRGAVVRAVQQELLQQRGVAGDEARTHARHVRALRQARQHHEPLEAAAEAVRGLEAAKRRRRFIEIDFRIALVGRDHETVAVGQREQLAPVVERQHGARRVAGRAHVQQLRARPDFIGHGRVVAREVAGRVAVREIGFGAGQQRRAFVNLIERIRTEYDRLLAVRGRARVDHRLGEREQRLSGARHRQHLRGRIDRRQPVAALEPVRDRRAQRVRAGGGRVRREAVERGHHGVADQRRRRVFGLADAEADRFEVAGRRHVLEQGAQLFEGIGLERVESRVHGRSGHRGRLERKKRRARRAAANGRVGRAGRSGRL